MHAYPHLNIYKTDLRLKQNLFAYESDLFRWVVCSAPWNRNLRLKQNPSACESDLFRWHVCSAPWNRQDTVPSENKGM